jgi:glycosyltransferase involved in cell wall biosynthesis
VKPRVAVICDYLEERWPSMDLAAEMLAVRGEPLVDVGMVRPRMPRWPRFGGANTCSGAPARALGRYVTYPVQLLQRRGEFDAFHVVDHSYGHLALTLPAERTGIYCHDLDAFRVTLEPRRSDEAWRKSLSKLLLAGLRRARVVFHSTRVMGEELAKRGLVAPERLVLAPLGVAPEFVPEPTRWDEEWARYGPYLLHVGSLIPRKNPQFLLEVFARIATRMPELRLVQIGGEWSGAHSKWLGDRGLAHRMLQRRGLTRKELAAVYRQATLVILPSTAEGFGIPVIEALGCGTPVVASRLPVLQEVGGDAIRLCAVGKLEEWSEAVSQVLSDPELGRLERLRQASRFSWAEHARIIFEAYRELI